MLNYATIMDVKYNNIHDCSKKSVKTAFFMYLVSSKRSRLVNTEQTQKSLNFPAKDLLKFS